MNRSLSVWAVSLIILSIWIVSSSWAEESQGPLSVEGAVVTTVRGARNSEGQFRDSLRTDETELLISGSWSEHLESRIKMRLNEDLRENGLWTTPKWNGEDFLKEANIRIKDIGGKPVAIVVGKQEVAYGLNHEGMVLYNDQPFDDINHLNKVFGFTVALEPDFLKGAKFEISSFESGEGDLRIGSWDGVSARLSKNISQQLSLTLSSMYNGHGRDSSDAAELRQSVGVMYETKDGKYVSWIEGHLLNENPVYPESHLGVTAGLTRKFSHHEITVEASLVDRYLKQVGVSASVELLPHLTGGVDVRYTDYEQFEDRKRDGVSAGVRFTVPIGKKNKNPIWGKTDPKAQ